MDISSEELCKDILDKTGVMLVPGKVLDMEGYIRIGYANSEDILKKGLSKLTEYLETYWG